jgi:predicted component of type VI protein secretion system
MVAAVQLTVLTGPHKDRRFCFCGPNQCYIGRAVDCFVQLCGTERDQLISRHHCKLDIDPPAIHLRDLGSTNGTFVNGKGVEASLKELSDKVGCSVNDGDLITVGGTTLRARIVNCPHAGYDQEGKPVWREGETAIKDCPLTCD